MDPKCTSKTLRRIGLLSSLLALALLAGCRSGPYMKADNAAGALQRAGNEVRAEVDMIDAVTNSLNDLTTNPTGDLRVQFGRFCDALSRLEKTASRAATRSVALRKDGEAYFIAWDRQSTTLTDEQIHQTSMNRKSETMKLFDASMHRYDEAQNNMGPLIGYLRDIRTALSVDLTMAGLQSAKGPANSAAQQAIKARESFTRTMADVDALAAKMCFFAPPAQPPVK